MALIYVVMALAITWIIVYVFRPNTVTVHFYYFPIILAAWYWKASGGIIIGLISGILAGPLMLLEGTDNVNQLTLGWLVRLAFFTTLGLFIGIFI